MVPRQPVCRHHVHDRPMGGGPLQGACAAALLVCCCSQHNSRHHRLCPGAQVFHFWLSLAASKMCCKHFRLCLAPKGRIGCHGLLNISVRLEVSRFKLLSVSPLCVCLFTVMQAKSSSTSSSTRLPAASETGSIHISHLTSGRLLLAVGGAAAAAAADTQQHAACGALGSESQPDAAAGALKGVFVCCWVCFVIALCSK